MALNFPSNPINGQTYGSYTYDATVGIWRSSSAGQGIVSTTTSAPTTAVSGDMWFNPNDGTMYVYYNDGTSGQWVESRAPITADGYQSPNYIINGGMDIWQRGTSFAAPTTEYKANTADRWNSFRGGFATGFTVSRQSAGLNGFQYCARIQRDSGNTSTASITFNQTFESITSIPLAGKTVTLSFYARAGATFSASGSVLNFGFSSGTGTDQNVQSGFTGGISIAQINAVLTTSWQRFTVTGTVPTTSTQLGVAGGFVPVGTAGANDYFEITGVQLEEGSVATTFRRNANSIQGEFDACQRYYQVFNADRLGAAGLCGRAGTIWEWSWQFVTPMRTTPTGILLNNGSVWSYTSGASQAMSWALSPRLNSIWVTGAVNASYGSTGSVGVVDNTSIAASAEL